MRTGRRVTWNDVLRIYGWTIGSSFIMAFTPIRHQVAWYISGPSFGFCISTAVILVIFLMPALRRPSFLLTVFLQVITISILMSLAFTMALAMCIAGMARVWVWEPVVWRQLATIYEGGVGVFAGLTVAITFVISAIHQVSKKLGPGILLNWLTGKYHEPREEERFFMFLDMKDSTTLAESLGNLKFSALVRDFFSVMGPVSESCRAEVSHFIGDEAVISWQVKNAEKNANPVLFFFKMKEAIQANADAFRKRYGLVPEFKSGLHIGPVVATEVGETKSEIVFHGDVMNSTARIQGLCNSLGHELLISEEAKARLGEAMNAYRLTPLGSQVLKGRVAPIVVYGVDQSVP